MVKIIQLPYLGSALAMTAGLYVLAGPFMEDREGVLRAALVWALSLGYQGTLLLMIRALRHRGGEVGALTLLSLFFLADPVFFGDAFSNVSGLSAAVLVPLQALAAGGLALGLAAVLGGPLRSSRVVAGLAALAVMHGIPAWCTWGPLRAEARVGLACWAASIAAVPVLLLRRGAWSAGAWVALAVHVGASAGIADASFDPTWLFPAFLSLSPSLPWPLLGWIPLVPALLVAPGRSEWGGWIGIREALGGALVATAFGLLGLGWSRSRQSGQEGGGAGGGVASIVKTSRNS